jgi:hypothetical protein
MLLMPEKRMGFPEAAEMRTGIFASCAMPLQPNVE